MQIPATREECEALDRADPLRDRRDQFALPDGVIYLDGHSLGPPTIKTLERVRDASMKEWAQGLIRSWNDAGWIDLPLTVGAKLARLIGAKPEEVVVTDNVSVNLFKLASAAAKLGEIGLIITEENEFPSDQYIAQGIGNWARVRAGEGPQAAAETRGVLIKSIVNYRTAQTVDVAEHERTVQRGGGVIVWDLCHSIGVLDHDLAAAGAKIAVGCTYKFLNGGPGAPAFVYVRNDVAAKVQSPISGWFGHAAPFSFEADYQPRANAARFASGTPGILSLSALAGALEVFEGVDLAELSKKAQALGDLCLSRAHQLGLTSISPSRAEERGGHISLIHSEGYAIVQALIARGVIADFRAPDAMRFGFSPLYVRHVDVWDAMDQLGDILTTEAWDQPEFHRRAAVT